MKDEVRRLLEDLRLLGPTGIERIAAAWREEQAAEDPIRTATERRAEDDPEWRAAETEIFAIARGEAWLSIPHTDRDSAVAGAQDALLAVLERRTLSKQQYRTLVRSAAAALPWLLTGGTEDAY